MTNLTLNVNGVAREVEADPETPLIFVLRNEFGLTGTKLACGLEQCGSCAVLADGECVPSCARAASEFAGRKVTTIEGLGVPGEMSAVQRAFAEEGAAQCGYCTPGIIMALSALLARRSRPSDEEIADALHGHLCRCGAHASILRAANRAIAEVSVGA